MMWFVTEGAVLRKIASSRWLELPKDRDLPKDERQATLAIRKTFGIKRNTFTDLLVDEQYSTRGLFSARAVYLGIILKERFGYRKGQLLFPKINDVIDSCVSKKYIDEIRSPDSDVETCLKITEPGKKRASRLYFFSLFIRSKHVDLAISSLIQWGVPALAIWFLSTFLELSVNPKL